MTPQAVLIDTNVVSYLYRNDSRAATYRSALVGRRGLISFQTYAELMVWAGSWSNAKRVHLQRWVSRRFGFLPHTPAVTDAWVAATLSAKRNGQPIAAADAWIAATAMNAGLLLLTADKNDFLGVDGLKLLQV